MSLHDMNELEYVLSEKIVVLKWSELRKDILCMVFSISDDIKWKIQNCSLRMIHSQKGCEIRAWCRKTENEMRRVKLESGIVGDDIA